jgi:hypothetical protein
MSEVMLCIELEKKIGLKTAYGVEPTYQFGGSFTIPANACAQCCSTPNAIA